MEKKQKETKKIFTKERIIAAAIGLVVGIILTIIIGLCTDYFAKSAGMARLKSGSQTIATVNGKTVVVDDVYESLKLKSGLSNLMNEIDSKILDDMYTLTDEEKEEAKEEVDYYINYNKESGYTEEEILQGYGFKSYEEFLADVETNIKYNKYIYDYIEKKLEPGAVEKYYNENKDTIETYDSEHILVKIEDEVTDEQALAIANEIIGKLNEGKSFEEVVEEYKDQITYEELGYQGKDSNLQDSYVNELVALQDGEYSKTPIKTTYGYHIVHKLATATKDDLRETIIEELASDLLNEDSNLIYKAFVELRKEKNLEIFDEDLKAQYEKYCERLNDSE